MRRFARFLLKVLASTLLVLIVAGIDLSVGSVMALAAAVLAVARIGWQVPLSAAVVLRAAPPP